MDAQVIPASTPTVIVAHSPAPSAKVMLSVNEFMDWYGFGRTKTYELLDSGEIEAVRAGSRTLIRRESADAYLARLPRYVSEKRAA